MATEIKKQNTKTANIEEGKQETRSFARVQNVTVPTIPLKDIGKSYFFRIEEEIRIEKTKDMKTQEMKDIHVVKVTNLENDQIGQIVVPAVLYSELMKNFEKLSGRAFEIIKREKKEGKNYHSYEIYVIKY